MKLFFPLLLFLFVFSGCIKKEDEPKQKDEPKTSAQDSILVIDEAWLKNKIENRNGKLLFINFWATWCEPCVEEFPDLVKIYNEHKGPGFEFLSVSVDLPSEIETKVRPFLKEQSAGFPVVVVEEKRSEEVINLINPDWNGAVPVTIIYDEKGNRKEFIGEMKSYEYFNESINKVKKL